MLTVKGSAYSIAPQSLAELVPIIPESYYYPEHMGMELEYRYSLYGEIYLHQPWVHAVINKRADALSKLPVKVWDVKNPKDGLTVKTLDTRSAYARLMANPCVKMDPFSFWGWIQRTIDIYGETFLAIIRDDTGAPANLLPMHPSRVAIKRRPEDGRYTYYFQAGAGIGTELVSFDEEDVVPFKLFNPNKLERGMSKMEAIRSTIFAEDSSRNATSAMWKNAGRPNIVLSSDNRLGEAGRKRLKAAFDNAHAGTGNAGKTLVLEDGVTATAMQITAVEMQFIEARQLNREEVCGVYDIAPPMVHILDRATFSNIDAQFKAFYRDTMGAPIQFIQSVINKHVGSYWDRNNTMEFSLDDVIYGDYENRVQAAHSGVAVGLYTPNEAREMVGLNRYDDPKADKLYANSAIQELGMPAEQIRMEGQVAGSTPDGVPIQAVPAQTPVATLDGSKPNSIPSAHPNAGVAKPVTNDKPKPNPKYYREIKGALGRNEALKQVALRLANKYPQELESLYLAIEAVVHEGITE